MAEKYVVTGATAVVTFDNGRTQYLNTGTPVPDGVTEECITHLLAVGLIEAEGSTKAAAAKAQAAAAKKNAAEQED